MGEILGDSMHMLVRWGLLTKEKVGLVQMARIGIFQRHYLKYSIQHTLHFSWSFKDTKGILIITYQCTTVPLLHIQAMKYICT